MEESVLLDEGSYEPDHVKHSVGGIAGHSLRRMVHLSMAGFPYLYYWHGDSVGGVVSLSSSQLVWLIIGIIAVAEAVRLKLGFTIIGQREYEARQLSALFWGATGLALTFLLAPPVGLRSAALGTPLVWGLAFGDPVMGESRRAGLSKNQVFFVGLGVVTVCWVLAWYFLATPLIFVLLMPLVQTASELPRLRWIDDNGTMILFPLLAILILSMIV